MNSNSISPLINSSMLDGSKPSKPSKLHDAAQQFEALVIGEMMRSQREAGSEGWLGSGDGAGDDSAMDMAEAQFSNALAAGGGLGLAKMIEKTMGHQADTARPLNTSSLSSK